MAFQALQRQGADVYPTWSEQPQLPQGQMGSGSVPRLIDGAYYSFGATDTFTDTHPGVGHEYLGDISKAEAMGIAFDGLRKNAASENDNA